MMIEIALKSHTRYINEQKINTPKHRKRLIGDKSKSDPIVASSPQIQSKKKDILKQEATTPEPSPTTKRLHLSQFLGRRHNL